MNKRQFLGNLMAYLSQSGVDWDQIIAGFVVFCVELFCCRLLRLLEWQIIGK